MKKLVAVFTTVVALIMVSTLTVQAKEAETYQEKVERMINKLEYAILRSRRFLFFHYIYTFINSKILSKSSFDWYSITIFPFLAPKYNKDIKSWLKSIRHG